MKTIVDWVWGGGNPGFPARAPPVVRQGGFVLSGTPVVQVCSGLWCRAVQSIKQLRMA